MHPRYFALIGLVALLLSGTMFFGCLQTGVPASAGLKKFSSPDELDQYVRQHIAKSSFENDILSGGGSIALKQGTGVMSSPSPMPAAELAASRDSSAEYSSGAAGAGEYSQTNVQVSGVDEADFVKNDGKYIYVISNSQLVIVDAYPGNESKIVSRTDFEGTPTNIFVNDDRVIVFCSDYSAGQEGMVKGTRMYSQGPATRMYIYSVADRKNPELVREYTAEGSYFDSRMIGDYVYFITKDPVVLTRDPVPFPVIRAGQKVVATPDVYYFDHPEQQFVFHVVSSVNIQDPDRIAARTFLLGYSNTLYVSENNMYISYPETVYETPRPLWEKEISALLPSSPPAPSKGPDLTQPDIREQFNRMTEVEKQAFLQGIQGQGEQNRISPETDRTSTVIHKLAINEGNIRYIAEGRVKGNLLNQFSMDEHLGNLRVATTSDVNTAREYYQYNNVIILNPEMKQVGSLTHLAMNEKIYSARFIGERLYLVTFKRIDPFFVIDLSDPGAPHVLGKLKIPGYSDYLHPYDSTHIIGVGKETATSSWGGVSTRGVKIALFDVSDVEHPKQVSHYEIGGSGTDSPALRDHRAFLFSKEKDILVLPVRVVQEYRSLSQGKEMMPPYRQKVWQGAYVFGITPGKGISLKGTISHADDDTSDTWYGSPYEVKRSLYIGNELSTISDSLIKINDIASLNTTIAKIDLGGQDYPVFPE